MSFALKDLGQLAISVNGTDLQVGADTVESCTLIEDVKSSSPTVHLKFVDNKKTTGGLGIFQDAVPIQITIGDGKNQPKQYKFRQWSLSDGFSNNAGEVCELSGVADLVPWLAKTVTKAYKGNATDVASKLAQEAGISLTDVTSSNDSMTWLPDGRTIGSFVRNVIDHAWLGEQSCLHMALTSLNGQWMLRVKDIMQKSSGTTLASVGLAGPSDIPIWHYRIESRGGPLNVHTAYGHKVVQEMLNGSVNIWQNLSFSPISSVPGINSALQSVLGSVRTFYHSPDGGNAHSNYAKAFHQNRAARSTFSVTLTLITDVFTSLKLMDDVTVNLATSDGTPNEAYSGAYKVSNIARNIAKGTYLEKITVTSQGTGQSASASVGAAAPSQTFPSSWPAAGGTQSYTVGTQGPGAFSSLPSDLP